MPDPHNCPFLDCGALPPAWAGALPPPQHTRARSWEPFPMVVKLCLFFHRTVHFYLFSSANTHPVVDLTVDCRRCSLCPIRQNCRYSEQGSCIRLCRLCLDDLRRCLLHGGLCVWCVSAPHSPEFHGEDMILSYFFAYCNLGWQTQLCSAPWLLAAIGSWGKNEKRSSDIVHSFLSQQLSLDGQPTSHC